MTDPTDLTPEQIAAVRARRAEGRDRRHAWTLFERHTHQAAMRAIQSTPDDQPNTNRPA